MGAAHRAFNKKQALEKEVKEIFAKVTFTAGVAAVATLDVTAPITLTSVALGSARNTNTFTLQVLAAAANPSNTVLVAFTGTAAAIICTVTPNDGTNNTATAVDLTTAELVELINSGVVVGKTITLTDASSRRVLQTAAGGDATALADAGEGDGEVATFADGSTATAANSGTLGISSIARVSDGIYDVTLEDKYYAMKCFKAIIKHASAIDLHSQLVSEAVSSTGVVRIRFVTGATPTEPPEGSIMFAKFELKNSSAV